MSESIIPRSHFAIVQNLTILSILNGYGTTHREQRELGDLEFFSTHCCCSRWIRRYSTGIVLISSAYLAFSTPRSINSCHQVPPLKHRNPHHTSSLPLSAIIPRSPMKSASTILALCALLSLGLAAPLGRTEPVCTLFCTTSLLPLFDIDLSDTPLPRCAPNRRSAYSR